METPTCLFHSWSHFQPHRTVTFCTYPLIPARAGLTIMCLWNMHQEFPGRDPAPSVQSVFLRLLPACCQWTSCCPLLFYAFPSLRPFLSIPLSPSHCHTHSLSHCIHFCAFKKSPRITNLAESELNGVTEDYKRKQNKDGPGDAFGSPPFYFFLFKKKYDSSMRVIPS